MSRRQHLRLVREPRTEVVATSIVSLGDMTSDEPTAVSMATADVFTDGWSQGVCNRFEEIDKLQPGWDGYDANSIAKSTLNFALLLLGNVRDDASGLAFPSINPMSNGSIMVEWRTGTHEITVEVNNTNDVDVLVEVLATGATREFHITSDFSEISDVLKQSASPVHAVA
jgi:hypothetical protein